MDHLLWVHAGNDEYAGRTWLGISEFDLVIGMINRHSTLGKLPLPWAIPWLGSGAISTILALTEEIQMCGRFTFQPTEAFYARFEISSRLDALTPRYNIAPGQMVPVIIANSPRRIVFMRWGLIPHWAKDVKTAYKMINARVETLTQRPAFRGLMSHNRCLVPACGYYEWQGEGREKTPYYIHPEDEQYIAFAGLYDVWINPTGEELYTFTIITTEADPFMSRLHNRMPVVMERDLEADWLDTEITSAADALAILERSAGVTFDAYPVSRMVNKPSYDTSALIQRVE
jgi:putative SOS response-associated peptidase YedK